jgi:hypothetical protein
VLIDHLREICREKREEYRHCKPLFQTVKNIIADAGKDDLEGYLALLEDAFPYMLRKQACEKEVVLQELQVLLADENIGTKTNRARLRFYQACCEKIYAEEPEIIEAKKNQIQQNCAKIGIYLDKRLRGEI